MLKIYFWLFISILLITPIRGLSKDTQVMLQGFHRQSHTHPAWWQQLSDKAQTIAKAGFDIVWLPPSSAAADEEGYLPTQLYTQENQYGTETQLRAAIEQLHQYDLQVIADIVINHRLGSQGKAAFSHPSWSAEAICSDDEWSQAQGHEDTGRGHPQARDIDHTQPTIQNSLIEWLTWLKEDIGYDGWRYDDALGYSGYYVQIYNQATQPSFAVGEVWPQFFNLNHTNAHRQQLANWINASGNTAAAFDFTTKGILQQAIIHSEYWRLKDSEGRLPGLVGWWPTKAVTFIENHDTETGKWAFPEDKIMQGYAYLLTHPGIPCVYWPHFFNDTWQHDLHQLIELRTAHQITAASSVMIQAADTHNYAAIINNTLAVRIGEDVWQPGSGWQQVLSGNDYAIWTQAQPQVRTVVYIYKKTSPGQRLFMRGGHEPRLVKFEHFPYTEEPIIYNNTLNPTTTLIKTTDSALDWLNNSALDWTTHQWNEDWGPVKFYPKHGYGQDPENTWGAYWWKFDVMMPGAVGDWFEFKALMKEGHHEIWEDKIVQEDTPYVSKHHWGKKGMITRVRFNDNWVDFMPLNTATLKANFIIMPQDIYVGDTLSLDASTSSYETNETAEFRWDWQNDGHYDTEWSTEATIQYTVTKAGEHTIKLEIRDQQDQRATQTSTINVKSKDHLIVHYQNLNNWVTPMMHWGFNYFAEGVTDTPLTGHDNYGPYFQVNWDSKAESLYLSFYDGHLTWDGIDRQLKKPAAFPAEIWIQNQDAQVYTQNPAPTVQLTTPKHGAILKGQVSLTATAHDNQGIVKVEFFYDAVRIATATSEPYTVQWDTTTIPDGIHTLTSKAYDAAGNVTTSAAKMVTTHNATLSPAAEESSKILFPRS